MKDTENTFLKYGYILYGDFLFTGYLEFIEKLFTFCNDNYHLEENSFSKFYFIYHSLLEYHH